MAEIIMKKFTAPGRVEICGNHTDHQNGMVLAASVGLHATALAMNNNSRRVNITSQGYGYFTIDLANLQREPSDVGTPRGLTKGVLTAFKAIGCEIGGFDAIISSEITAGSGLSSSAAFEVLIGRIVNGLFNGDEVNDIVLARIGQYAENFYFGKPSGLMDQTVCAVGGLISIDFQNPSAPEIELLDAPFADFGYKVCVVNTGTSHDGLTEHYARIPSDMKHVASYFGKSVLRDLDPVDFFADITGCGMRCGERAVLRAIHFFLEEGRVREAVCALKAKDFADFLEVINESGRSSRELLRNVRTAGTSGLAPALDLSEKLLEGSGATRVHGGGFAGSILAIVPEDRLEMYKEGMEQVFKAGACNVLNIG